MATATMTTDDDAPGVRRWRRRCACCSSAMRGLPGRRAGGLASLTARRTKVAAGRPAAAAGAAGEVTAPGGRKPRW